MRMPDLSDEELDALFRQGAEHYPEELNLGAWARMEQQLDEARVQQLVNRKVARWFAAEVGIVAVLLLLWGSYREYFGEAGQQLQAATAAAAPQQSAAARRSGAATGAAGQSAAQLPRRAATGATRATAATSTQATAEARAPHRPGHSVTDGTPLAAAPAGPIRLLPSAADEEQPETVTADNAAASTALSETSRGRRRRNQPPLAVAAGGMVRRSTPAGAAGAERIANTTATQAARRAAGASAVPIRPGLSRQEAGKAAARSAATAPAGVDTGLSTARPGAAVSPALPAADEAAHPPHPGAPLPAGTAALAPTAATESAAPEVGMDAVVPLADALAPVQPQLLPAAAGELPALLPASDSVVRRRPRPFVPSRIFITGLYAPELSTVRNAGYERVGRSAGIQVEYLIMPRLRLNVGLLSSVKYYQARGTDYTWARPPSYTVDRIEATCRITDIPVNLRFDALQGVRYRAFVSAGLSSLLMRDESYYYSYSYYGSPRTNTWQVKKSGNHPFSVVNVSAGLERQLSLRWALQAEPYLKLPLGGVGAGKVRLSSGGVFFGLKYGL